MERDHLAAPWLWIAVVLGAASLQALSFFVFPSVPMPPALGFAFTFGSVTLCVVAASATVPRLLPRALIGLAFPLGLLAFAWLARDQNLGIGPALLVTLGLLFAGTLVGSVIGARVQHPGHLLLVAYVSMIADVYSVSSETGVTAQIVENKPLLSILAISWAFPGVPDLTPVLGVGDVVMTALYLVASRSLGLSVRRSVVAMFLGYVGVFFALLILQRPLAALPFLGVAFVLLQPACLRLRKEDRRPALVGAILVTVAFVVLALRG
ncbi:MAG: hypothetical protein KC416_06505 [Myxococcales bacterium]|nr:hypothetical protein [Myxococcales bacterium]